METSPLTLKPNPKFRQYRAEHQNGRFEIIKKTIKKPQDLQDWINENNPKNVYETTATFWNPKTIRGVKKSTYKWTQQIIDHLVLIDIDDLNSAKVLKVLDFFKTKSRYEFWKMVCSGGGYHVYYEDMMRPTKLNPQERIEWFKKERTDLASELLEAGIEFDVPVLTDPYRISRVIGTWNGNKAAWCKEIDMNSLINESAKPTKKKRKLKNQNHKISIYTLLHFISNKVPNIKDRYIPVMIWPNTFDYKLYLKSNLKLGKIYIFELPGKIMAVSLKTVSPQKLTKILKKTHSSNLSSWVKYKHCWIYLAYKTFKEKPDISNRRIRDVVKDFKRPRFVEVLDSSSSGFFISKPHSKIFGAEGGYLRQHGELPLKEHLVMRYG